MSHCRFTVVSPSSFHTPGISMRSMCTASLCDLRDPGWGDSGFRHCDFFCLAPVGSSSDFDGFVLLVLRWMTCSGRGSQAAWSLRFMRSFLYFHSTAWLCCSFWVFVFAGCAVFVWLVLFLVFLVFAFFVPCGMTSYDLTPRVSEAVTASASLAVIKTASKHLQKGLARAIEALEQKKSEMEVATAMARKDTTLRSCQCQISPLFPYAVQRQITTSLTASAHS